MRLFSTRHPQLSALRLGAKGKQSTAQDPPHLLDEKEHASNCRQDRDEFYEPILFEAFNYIFQAVFEFLTTWQHALNGWIAQKRKNSIQKAAMRGVIGEYDMIPAFQRYEFCAGNSRSKLLA